MVNVKFSVKPERCDELLKMLKIYQIKTMMEPGALQFRYGLNVEDPNTFCLHEQYNGEEAFETHTLTPHYALWTTFAGSGPFTVYPVGDTYLGTHAPVKRDINKPAIYCLNVKLCIKPEVREEFLEVIRVNAATVNNDEALCLQFDYGESTKVPNTFYLHEEYEGADGGKEGFDAHEASPHFAVWEKFKEKGIFTQPGVVSFYRTV